VILAVNQLNYLVVERIRSARRFIRSVSKSKNIDDIIFIEFDKDGNNGSQVSQAIELLKNGTHVGLMSEAGAPCIADPGNIVVAAAHRLGIRVKPLVGPSSMFLALMASGMNGQSFAFNGYLSINKEQLSKELSRLESISAKSAQTQLFMETPYRNDQLWEVAVKTLKGSTKLGFAVDLTLATEKIEVRRVDQWKKQTKESLHKRPTIFMLSARDS
jgi:16S rRNA (cytidine1402-2'-O)-methyltransferase